MIANLLGNSNTNNEPTERQQLTDGPLLNLTYLRILIVKADAALVGEAMPLQVA
jgi:hypothetical protein